MEYQFRRGIYRPNAQRLSLSLAPLVAQRSLLFRVKADLATKTHYSELTPTDELDSANSPALFLVTATASARVMSAARSAILSGALSSCSIYSQDSWQGPSPFIHKVAHSPLVAPRGSNALIEVDTRRHAIAFSPSVQWESMSDELSSCAEIPGTETTPQSTQPVHLLATSPIQDVKDVSLDVTSIPAEDPSLKDPPTKLAELVGGPVSTLKKKNNAANRVSKHAKALGKAISHLSMPPSLKSKEDVNRRLTIANLNIKHLGPEPEFKLPTLRIRVSPIRTSFINKPSAVVPRPLLLPQMVAEKNEDAAHASEGVPVRPRPPRSIRPVTPSCPRPPTTPAPPPGISFKKGHKRYNSSPAVLNFNFNFNARDNEDVPPLPAMPSFVKKGDNSNGLPPRPRASSVATHGHVRAISVPFPVRRSIS